MSSATARGPAPLWSRREVLAAGTLLAAQGLFGVSAAFAGTPEADGAAVLASALGWLEGQRSHDGRYPSRVYGLLKGGASTSPFVLLALDAAGALDGDAAAASLAALAARCDESGALGLNEVVSDYPCYATGMMLFALSRHVDAAPPGLAERSRAWLLDQQLSTRRGWQDHPALGGWGMGARSLRTPPDAGHVDLSMTRRVIEGLVASGLGPEHPALLEARSFVARCQSEDGSFFYSPVELHLNKGETGPNERPRGYGSATTDGWHALAALGFAAEPSAKQAHAWLLEHHRVDANPGVEGGPMHAFAEAMRGYYRAGSATVFARAGGPADWRAQLVDAIAADQREDGSFSNPNPLQKEDDPLIATAFAVVALAAALEPSGAGGPNARA